MNEIPAGYMAMHLRISGRIYFLIAIFATGCTILAVALNALHARQFVEARHQSLTQLVDTAIGVFEANRLLVEKGAIDEAEARKRALATLDAMRYNGNDYFFVVALDGTLLLSPAAPQFVGQNRKDTSKDASGKLFMREMLGYANSPAGQGFVDYTYVRPGSTEMLDKVSFIKAYKPWGVAVATGVYVEDLKAARAQSTWQAFAITSVLLLVVGAIALVIANSIANPLKRLNAIMKQIIAGETVSVEREAKRRDEIGEMAQSVALFQEGAIARARAENDAAAQRRRSAEEHEVREREKAEEARRMHVTIDALGEGLTRLAQGDLMCRLESPFPAETEKLREDFNSAVAKLQDAIACILASANTISSGVFEISTASDDLSRRTEQQAATLEETASALDQITATVKKAATGSSHAREVVSTAKLDAESAGSVVGKAVEAMSGIEKSSEQIGQILGVIDEIAFQTNLLALNAGVEAARAGEAGRGFAVVAAEVRALAQRSADAAREIKDIIRLSAVQVADGVNLVAKTGQSLERIMAQVNDINAVMADLAVGAQEQATSLTQVNTALNDMDGVTQQNAAMVEETTAASHSLRTESETLTRLIGQFRVGREAETTTRTAATKTSAPRRPQPGAKPRLASSNVTPLPKRPVAEALRADSWKEF